MISGQRIPYSHRVPTQPVPAKGPKNVVNNQQHHPECSTIGGTGLSTLPASTLSTTPKKTKKKSAAEKKREKAAADATILPGMTGSEAHPGSAAGGGKSSFRDDDDINDVAAMGGVNLLEESQRILAGNAENIGQQIRSVKDEIFLHATPLHAKVNQIGKFFLLKIIQHFNLIFFSKTL